MNSSLSKISKLSTTSKNVVKNLSEQWERILQRTLQWKETIKFHRYDLNCRKAMVILYSQIIVSDSEESPNGGFKLQNIMKDLNL